MSSTETIELADSRQLEYIATGAKSGTPVVFCHGTPGSCLLGRVFEESATAAGVRVLTPSRPGYGRSEPPTAGFESWATDCVQLLDALAIDRTTVWGFSGGGPFALGLAATVPERVQRVELIAPVVPETSGGPFEALSRVSPLLGAVLWLIDWSARIRGPEMITGQLTNASVSPALAELVGADFHHAIAATTVGAIGESQLFADGWELPAIPESVPLGLTHGRADSNVRIEPVLETLGDRCDRITTPENDHLGTLLARRMSLVNSVNK
ncbi:alpha/beta hydrolase [Halocatena halophila]|uniref:alpha/beta hydrolase n=1 Tax=Halocatena halophila TaxID=2814576 RepID=UPI002ED2EF2B